MERGVVRIGVALPELEARGAMLDLRSGAIVSVDRLDVRHRRSVHGERRRLVDEVELLRTELELRLPVGAGARYDAAPAEDGEGRAVD